MAVTIHPQNMVITGTYTGNKVLEYVVKIYPNQVSSQWTIEIANYNRNIQLQLKGGSTVVNVRTDDGDGTFSNLDEADGIPIWIGDKIYEVAGQPSVAGNIDGYIGKVASITTGTEGDTVTKFELDTASYLTHISGTDLVDILADYRQQPISAFTITGTIDPAASTTVTGVGTRFTTEISVGDEILVSGETRTVSAIASVTSLTVTVAFSDNLIDTSPYCIPSSVISSTSLYQGVGNKFTHENMYGLSIHFASDFSGLLAPSVAGTYHYFTYSAYPQKLFNADTMVRLMKDGKTHIVGWNEVSEQFSILRDVYDEDTNQGTIVTEADSIQSTPIPTKPTLVSRGDDTYIGRGPDTPPLYIGYPNIKQFGKNMGDDLVIADGALSLTTSVLPALEQFVLPAGSPANSVDLNLDLTLASQLIVGYVKGSSYLIKGRRDTGIESSYYIGGVIMAIYLDHIVNDEVWVVSDAVGHYKLTCFKIGGSGVALSIKANRVFALESANDEADMWINPFMKTEVIPSDMVYLDDIIYISATDADYGDPDKAEKDKCFGIGDNRQHYIWRSAPIGTISETPLIGYTVLAMTSITPNATTGTSIGGSVTNAGIPYWYKWKEHEWWQEGETEQDPSSNGTEITEQEYYGDANSRFRVRLLPSKRGLCVYSNKSGSEGVALLIKYVHNSFQKPNHTITYQITNDGDSNDGWTRSRKRIGPFIKQNSKNVALGAHLIIWNNSAASDVASNLETGIKRINVGSDSRALGNSTTVTATDYGSNSEASVKWYGDGGDWGQAHDLSASISAPAFSGEHPYAISVCTGSQFHWWDLSSAEAGLKSSTIGGHFYLNGVGASPKHWTPAGNGAITPASQTFSYITTGGAKFSWSAVTRRDAFKCYFLDDTGNKAETVDWEEWDLLSAIKFTISDPGGTVKDKQNLTPSADLDSLTDSSYYKNFYKISIMLDGYQESCLGETVYYGNPNPNENGHTLTLEVLPDMLPSRISHVNIYRARAWDNDATKPDLEYTLVESVALDGNKWVSSSGGYVKYEFIDNKGANFGSFEALTGISPAMTTNWVAYGESEQCAGYLFVSNASNEEMTNVGNYVFRSKAGKFSMFNWANEYVALPDKPTALKAYKNILFVFTDSKVYAINPTNLSIVDTINGMGCLSPESVITTEFGMFFTDKHGVYQHDGRKGQIISRQIFTTDNSSLTNFTWDSISESLVTSPPKLGFDGQRKALFVVFDVSGSSYAWVYSVVTKRWDLWSFTSQIKSLTQGKFGEILASDGKLLQVGTSSIRKPWEFISKKITAGFDTYEKSFTEIHVEGDSGLTTTYKTSGVSSYQSLTSNRIASGYKKAKWLQLRIVDADGTRELESIGVHLRPLRAKSSKI